MGQQLGEQGDSAKLYCGMWHAAPVTVKVSKPSCQSHAVVGAVAAAAAACAAPAPTGMVCTVASCRAGRVG